MKVVKTEQELHPHGLFRARVKRVIDNEPNQYGDSVTIVYQTQYGEVWDRCSLKLSPMAKLTDRVCAILDCSFDEIPKEFDTSDLEGHLCQIIVKHVDKGDRTFAVVDSAIRFEQESSKAKAPAPKDESVTDDDIPF